MLATLSSFRPPKLAQSNDSTPAFLMQAPRFIRSGGAFLMGFGAKISHPRAGRFGKLTRPRRHSCPEGRSVFVSLFHSAAPCNISGAVPPPPKRSLLVSKRPALIHSQLLRVQTRRAHLLLALFSCASILGASCSVMDSHLIKTPFDGWNLMN